MSRILVLGTADWQQSIATNQHYVVRELSTSHDVIYLESMGLRAPQLSIRDLRRAAYRLRNRHSGQTPRSYRPVPVRTQVRSPLVIPRHTGLAYKFNQPRVHRLVEDWLRQAVRPLWTYTPVTYGLERIATHVVYHCVDLLGEVEGIPRPLIHRSEQSLSSFTNAAIATSPSVSQHLQSQGFRDVTYWPNVADTSTIAAAKPSVREHHPRRVVFAGNLSTSKVDFKILHALLDAKFDLHLAGPIAEGGGAASSEVAALVQAGATYHGLLGPEALARLYWTAQVGTIPYVLNSYTSGVNPLKTYEYMAAGLAVVSTGVPAVRPLANHIRVAGNVQAFVAAVEEAANETMATPELGARRELIASKHSWERRGQEVRRLVSQLVDNSAPPGGSWHD